MLLQIIKVITETRFKEKLYSAINKPSSPIIESWHSIDRHHDRLYLSLLIQKQDAQKTMDKIENICGRTSKTHILALPVSGAVSAELRKMEQEEEEKPLAKSSAIPRDELYHQVVTGARLNIDFIILLILSTIVAAIGLLENNTTVLIGAMVIAPLLGPNLAMSLATTLGDWKLMMHSMRTNLTGIAICIVLGTFIGSIWPYGFSSVQLLLRTNASYDSAVLAMASGAAAVLSITSGVSSVLVGVMVSTALLPPVTALGIMLGTGNISHAIGAGLLFAINIVCINLVANLTFLWKGIGPNRWYEKKKAKKAVHWNIAFWTILLLILVIVIFLRRGLAFESLV